MRRRQVRQGRLPRAPQFRAPGSPWAPSRNRLQNRALALEPALALGRALVSEPAWALVSVPVSALVSEPEWALVSEPVWALVSVLVL